MISVKIECTCLKQRKNAYNLEVHPQDNNSISSIKTHLIFTSIITNSRLRIEKLPYASSDLKCINQFLTSVHSMSKLDLASQNFYLELDEEFSALKNTLESHIKRYFPRAIISWKRLEFYQDWKQSSESVPNDSNLILLQSNFDHAYVANNESYFSDIARNVHLSGDRSVGEITHWPEALSEISNPWRKNQQVIYKENFFQRNTTNIVGTALLQKTLYEEIWREDFTHGFRITRPDNPFGPSVKFPPANLIIPKIELFRHLDGYEHVGIRNNWMKEVASCCEVKKEVVEHKNWVYCDSSSLLQNSQLCNLADDEIKNQGIHLNLIIKAISHRIDYTILRILIYDNKKFNLKQNIKITLQLCKYREFRLRIFRLCTDLTLGYLLVSILIQSSKIARNNLVLSQVMSNGWRSILRIDFGKAVAYNLAVKIGLRKSN
jgi:hypothetical protein